jgi:amidophosphoribosyltransferase
MCGIIGIIGSQSVAEDLFIGMLNLQHRGQDAAGILTFKENFYIKKGLGLVERVFTKKDIEELPGNIGIGHNRYPTVGFSYSDTQPFFLTYPYGVGMAHNGNVINCFSLKKYLKEKKRRITYTDNDLELILNLFSDKLTTSNFSEELVYKGVKEIYKKAIGGYSVVGIVGDKGLFAFKDPRGIRPLVIGKRVLNGETSYAFTSEDVVFHSLGYKVERDLKAGEVVFIDKNLKIHSKVLTNLKEKHCMFEWVYLARAESVINGLSVYKARLSLGKELAKKLKGVKADLIVPVPDTSRTAALSLSEELKIPYREGLIKNRYIGRTFIMSSPKERENAVRLKLNVVYSEISGKDIIVVDDSIVRGTTSKKIINLLRNSGARKVYFVATCPPLKYPCFYGIDFPTSSELIAFHKSENEIRKTIGSDLLFYQDLKSLSNVLGENICKACLDGNYEPYSDEAKIFEKERIKVRKCPKKTAYERI